MRRHRLLAPALSALLISALSPALAQAKPPPHAHGKGPAKPEAHDNGRPDKPEAHDNGRPDKPEAHDDARPDKPAKPAKGPKASRFHLSGGGVTQLNAEFSVQGKSDKPGKGHFHYVSADGRFHVKCRGFDDFVRLSPTTVRVGAKCESKTESLNARPVRTDVDLVATFVDKGEPGTTDEANISITTMPPDNGVLKSGNIQIK